MMPETQARVRIDSSFKFDVQSGRYESGRSWAQVRIKKDSRRGDYYIDVLFGDKGESRPHTHMGINGDQTLRFLDPRGTTQSVTNTLESKLEGHLYTKRRMLIEAPARSTLSLKINIDIPTKTIRLLLDEISIQDIP
jgi:hypothetical protein